MRTTIEITTKQRSQLLALAAMRNKKGFSEIVQEALDEYLASRLRNDSSLELALSQQGSLDDAEAETLRSICAEVRERWR